VIGIFDSGVGGLTVVKEIFKYLIGPGGTPQIIYFGDTARLPYGTKGANFVKKYSKKITEWLLKKGCKIIVIACNTSSAWASDYLKKEFPKIPIFEMITPAVEEVSKLHAQKIGIIGTPGTIKSRAYDKKLKNSSYKLKIYSQACPLFVPLIEEGMIDGKITEAIISKYLDPLREKKIEALVLACTHYPLLKREIEKIIDSGIKVINPAEALAKEVCTYIDNNRIKLKTGKSEFYFSDTPYNLTKISQLCFSKKIIPIVKDPFDV